MLNIPPVPTQNDTNEFVWLEWFRTVRDFVNKLTRSETTTPTTGTSQQGQFIWNKTPIELGTGGSKYVVLGWVCTVGGTPGTWLECRTLTGN